MCVTFNLKLVTAEVPFRDTTITSLLGDVNCSFMEDVVVMGTDLMMSKLVKKIVFY